MAGGAIQEILTHYLGAVAKQQLERKMEARIPEIASKMIGKGMAPENTSLPLLVHDALFRLWRVVIPSGDMTDFIRDRQNDKVVALVLKAQGDNHDLVSIISRTLDALLAVTF
jgi:hypothetical protein